MVAWKVNSRMLRSGPRRSRPARNSGASPRSISSRASSRAISSARAMAASPSSAVRSMLRSLIAQVGRITCHGTLLISRKQVRRISWRSTSACSARWATSCDSRPVTSQRMATFRPYGRPARTCDHSRCCSNVAGKTPSGLGAYWSSGRPAIMRTRYVGARRAGSRQAPVPFCRFRCAGRGSCPGPCAPGRRR